MRRLASAVLAGTALIGVPLVTAGVASANSPSGHHEDGKGSLIYAPVNAPVQTNTCGNTINTVGELNPAFGNTCVNGGGIDSPSTLATSPVSDSSSIPSAPTLPSLPAS